jgi:hypothetical protein
LTSPFSVAELVVTEDAALVAAAGADALVVNV